MIPQWLANPTVSYVAHHVAEITGIPAQSYASRARYKELIICRWLVRHALIKHYHWSLAQVGRATGNADRRWMSLGRHYIDRIALNDPQVAEWIRQLDVALTPVRQVS